ncbi:MAG: MmgE/PrpD family protein [Pseudomonadota bacterium]
MSEAPQTDKATTLTPTRDIANWAATLPDDQIDALSMRWARHCLLDWCAVTIAARDEDLVRILVEEALADGAEGRVPIAGHTYSVTPSWAALVNGAASHALDYDDVNTAMFGHPTVPVMPAVLVAGASAGQSIDQVLRAFAVGYEVCCLVGQMSGPGHYHAGWHATATMGCFGAAAGTARLMGLDAGQTAQALGSAVTMAAGLKSMFGTMCKPLHAGRAAQSGYLAARMASRGWVSRDDALECAQGFWATQGPGAEPFDVARQDNQPLQIQNNLFKYHAACYMTHSTIEACRDIAATHAPAPDQIAKVRVRVPEPALNICNIPDPETGLEVKFSLRHTAAMALSGIDTASIEIYSDATAQNPVLVALRQTVQVEPKQQKTTMDTDAEVIVETRDGTAFTNVFDVGVPAKDADLQEKRLGAKFDALVVPILGAAKAETLKSMILSGESGPLEVLRACQFPTD